MERSDSFQRRRVRRSEEDKYSGRESALSSCYSELSRVSCRMRSMKRAENCTLGDIDSLVSTIILLPAESEHRTGRNASKKSWHLRLHTEAPVFYHCQCPLTMRSLESSETAPGFRRFSHILIFLSGLEIGV